MDDKNDKYKKWGKMGGRPSKNDNKKTERINLFFTKKEMEFLIQECEKKNIGKINDYARIVLLNKTIPNFEQNKTLIKYAHNFTLISNYMKMGIFNEEEKKRLIAEIKNLVEEIKNKIQWL